MEFDKLVNLILEQNLGSRVSIGSDEIRDILKNKRITSREPAYKGHTFFSDSPAIDSSNQQYLPRPSYKDKFGSKLGYVIKADKSVMQRVPKDITIGAPYPEYYDDRGYKVTKPNTPSSSIKTIQRIKVAPQLNQFKEKDIVMGKERDFNRFMQIYNKLSKAFQEGKIKVRPPRINPSAGMAGMTALMQFMNDEVPPDMRNSLMSGGGLGIKGKFEATP